MSAPTLAKRPWRATTLRLAIVLGLLAVVIAGVPLERLTALSGSIALAALVLQVPWGLGYLLRGYRHAIVLSDPPAPLVPCTKAVLLAGGLNAILPARLGELVTATYVRNRLGIPLNIGLAAVGVERLADLIIFGLFALAAMGTGVIAFTDLSFIILGTGLAFVVVCALAFIDWTPLLIRLQRLVPGKRVRAFLLALVTAMNDRFRGRKGIRLIVVTLFCWLVSLVGIHLFVWIVWSTPPSLAQSLLVLLGALVGSAIPGLPGGLGTFEAGVAGAFMILGQSFEEAILIAMALHIATLAQPVLATVLLSYYEDFGIGQMVSDIRARKDSPQP